MSNELWTDAARRAVVLTTRQSQFPKSCGSHYLGRDRDLRGADCILHAGHDGEHESHQHRRWLT